MKSPFTSWTEPLVFGSLLAIILGVFLWGVGLGPGSLPFPPQADFSDAVTSHWANALFLRRSVLEDHAWPLWRPLIMSGQPFAANPLDKVWYPPQWLVFLLPPIVHLNILTWLHLIAAGCGAWAWSRVTGLQPWPAALAGFGYAFGPRLIASVGAGHLDLVYAAAWFPWLLWAVNRAVQLPSSRGSILWLALFAALCFLADVRLSAYVFVTAAAYFFWRWSQEPALKSRAAACRTGLLFITAALLAAGLTAIQWVPLLLMKSDLSRGSMSLHDAAFDSLKWGQWIGLIIGDHGGHWETMIYVGISTLILAGTALVLRPRQFVFWGLIILFAALYAMGGRFVVWSILARLVPLIRWWRVPPRIWFIAALLLPYLAGWGAQLLAEQPPGRRSARLSVVGLLGGGLTCGLFSTITLAPPLKLTAALGLFALPAVALVMLLAIFGKLAPRALMALFTLVVAADVLWMDRTLIEGRSEQEWLEPYRELADYLKADGAVRIYSPSYSLPQQAGIYWEIPQFGGVDPFQFTTYQQAAEAATGVYAGGYSVTIPAYKGDLSTANQGAPINPELLGRWLVTHVLSDFEIKAEGLTLETRIGKVYVYRNTLAPEVNLTWDGPNRVSVRAKTPYQGSLYAVAAGRWKQAGHSPGLPGEADGSTQEWTFQYDPSEVWISLSIGSVMLVLACVGWWMKRHV